jgi:hypothetical protein
VTRIYRPGSWVVLRSDGRVVAWGHASESEAREALAEVQPARPSADYVVAQVVAPNGGRS